MPTQDYDVLVSLQASVGEQETRLGERGKCRFCPSTDISKFKSVSHTFPEGLGNKWFVSLDECDECNTLFSIYDDSLIKSVGPLLTVGGTKGKDNKVRQTGRSKGSHSIKHHVNDEGRRISYNLMNLKDEVSSPEGTSISFLMDGTMMMYVPTPLEKFVPRYAYKCLAKMALAVMPMSELCNFRKLLEWVKSPDDAEEFPFLDVGLSLGSLGNAPEIISASLLRRKPHITRLPYMIFIFCAGSVCWQLDVMPDERDDACDLAKFGWINIGWSLRFQADDEVPIDIKYSQPTHFDWSSNLSQAIPVQGLLDKVADQGRQVEIVADLRPMNPSEMNPSE